MSADLTRHDNIRSFNGFAGNSLLHSKPPAIHQVLWRAKMITQERVWNAIDKIAKLKGLSLMGLSKASGLDYGVLAKSRRMLPYGIVHYPSMTTIQKVLSATDISFIEFAKMVEENAES